ESLRELVMDTLFVFNLADLSHLLEGNYAFDERRFWSLVRSLLDTFARTDACDADRLRRIGHDAPLIRAESLLTRRLMGRRHSEFHHWVSNPLAEGKPA